MSKIKNKLLKFYKIVLNNPLKIIDYILMRFLTYNYSSPYCFRNTLYKLRLKLNKKLNIKSDFINNDKVLSLQNEGFLLNIYDLDKLQIKELKRDLSFIEKKNIFSKAGSLTKQLYNSEQLSETYSFLKLATEPEIIKIVSSYLGCLPIIQFLSCWNTFSNKEELNEMSFHMDHHGHKFLKLFFYLTDVRLSEGHHEFIVKTHIQKNFDGLIKKLDNKNNHLFTQIKSKRKYGGNFLMNDKLIEKFLKKNIIQVHGKAGLSFIEDTRGLHRGTSIKNAPKRTVFQVLYTSNNNYKDPIMKGRSKNAFNAICKESQLSKNDLKILCSKILSFN